MTLLLKCLRGALNLESMAVGGDFFWRWGKGNEFQVIIGVHMLSSCTTGRDIERNDKVSQKKRLIEIVLLITHNIRGQSPCTKFLAFQRNPRFDV